MTQVIKRGPGGRFVSPSNKTEKMEACTPKACTCAPAPKAEVTAVSSPKETVKAPNPSVDQAKILADQTFSFSVTFIREKDLNGDGSVKANPNHSDRRFGTRDEAQHHGVRFTKIGNHAGFFLREHKNQKPNSWINVSTGLTNPVL